MKTKIFTAALVIVMAVLLSSCNKSSYEETISYIDELSEEVLSATTDEEFDEVYNKIIEINNHPQIKKITEYPSEQKGVIIAKTAQLTRDALAVKAILYVLPKDIHPTADDMKEMVGECLEKRLNITSLPYSEVRELVYKHFSISE